MTIAITTCVIAVSLLILPSLALGSPVFLQGMGNISYPLHSLVFLEEHPNEVLWYTFAFASEDGGSDEENGDEGDGDEGDGDEGDGDEGDGDEGDGDDEGGEDSRGAFSPNSGGLPSDLSGSAPWSGSNTNGGTATTNTGKPRDLTPGATTDLGPGPIGNTVDMGHPAPAPDFAAPQPGTPEDLDSNTGATSRTFTHNTERIALELSAKTPLEISQYPITALSANDLRLVLGFLDPINLAKVLLNISPQDLQTIQVRLSGDNSFANLLNRLSLSDRSEVERRLSFMQ